MSAEVIGEDELCSFCGNGPGKAIRTSRGEGLVVMCLSCRLDVGQLLRTLHDPSPDQRFFRGLADGFIPAPKRMRILSVARRFATDGQPR